MPRRVSPWARAAAVALLIALLLVPAGTRAASAALQVHPGGTIDLAVSVSITNGSALREAIDGNFTALVDAITSNATQRITILGQIAAAEGTPFLGSFFGNRDGTVQSGEVTQFESLLQNEAQLVPSGSLTGGSFLAFTLDGAKATSMKLDGVTFTNATGPVRSTGPVGVTTALSYSFPESGTTHTVALTTNLITTPVPLGLITGAIGLDVVTPAGTSITGTVGFDQVTVANDPLGWGTSSLSGSYTPTTSGTLSVTFAPAVPWGDVVLVVPVVAAVAGLGAFLWIRRRRRRRAASA